MTKDAYTWREVRPERVGRVTEEMYQDMKVKALAGIAKGSTC
jgi:hypothetical protein